MNTSTKVQNFQYPYLELDPNKILFAPNDKGEITYEIWKDVPNFIGYYQVSNFGRIKSLSRNRVNRWNKKYKTKEKILKQNISNKYLKINLSKKSIRTNYSVHLLMSITFLNHKPKGTSKLVCDHIDNISLNNKLWNLQLIPHRLNCSKDRNRKLETGVYKTKKGYIANISINGKKIHLGSFSTKEEASIYRVNSLKSIESDKPIEIKKTPFKQTSKHKYIYYYSNRKKWRVQKTINGKKKTLGQFKTEIDAINFLKNN